MSRPKYTLRLLKAAEEDLFEIVTYIAADNLRAAAAVATKIEKKINLLSRHPYLGQIPEDPELVRMGYRYLIVGNYLIFYTLETQVVLVHRILHGARNYAGLL